MGRGVRAGRGLLEHRPGNYLLVRSGGEPARLRASTAALRPLVGPSLRIERSDTASAVSLDHDAWALLEIEDPAPDGVVVDGLTARTAEASFVPWVPGGLAALEGAGIWRVRGPEPRVQAEEVTEDEPVDEELLEALRRLGYVE